LGRNHSGRLAAGIPCCALRIWIHAEPPHFNVKELLAKKTIRGLVPLRVVGIISVLILVIK
jgi:hypothetical protein